MYRARFFDKSILHGTIAFNLYVKASSPKANLDKAVYFLKLLGKGITLAFVSSVVSGIPN